jgi:hypothetical protein
MQRLIIAATSVASAWVVSLALSPANRGWQDHVQGRVEPECT